MNAKASIKCTCGANNKTICSNCSKIKMVILLKGKHHDLKQESKNGGKKTNPVWYNYVSKNRYSDNSIINALYKAFQKSEYQGKANLLNFYSNITGNLLTSIKV